MSCTSSRFSTARSWRARCSSSAFASTSARRLARWSSMASKYSRRGSESSYHTAKPPSDAPASPSPCARSRRTSSSVSSQSPSKRDEQTRYRPRSFLEASTVASSPHPYTMDSAAPSAAADAASTTMSSKSAPSGNGGRFVSIVSLKPEVFSGSTCPTACSVKGCSSQPERKSSKTSPDRQRGAGVAVARNSRIATHRPRSSSPRRWRRGQRAARRGARERPVAQPLAGRQR